MVSLIPQLLYPRPRVRVKVCVQVDVQRLRAWVYVLGMRKRNVPPKENIIQTRCGTAQGWRTKPSIFLCLSRLDESASPALLMASP